MENIMDTLTPRPPFDPRRKNQSVQFHPILIADTNKYQRLSQKGIDRTQKTIPNGRLGIRTDGTELTANEMNSKINID